MSSMYTSMEDGDSYISNTDAIIYGTCDHSGLGGDSMISDPNIVLSSTSTDDYYQQQHAVEVIVLTLNPKRSGTCSSMSSNQKQRSSSIKLCQFTGCVKGARGASGLCIGHGGGPRCQRPGCIKAAKGRTAFCMSHGGGQRCEFLGCTKSAQGRTDFCIAHGGGRRCCHEGCLRAARGQSGLCIRHGGGRRCEYPQCTKGAQGGTTFCKAHAGGKRCTFEGCNNSAEESTPFCKGHGGGERCSFQGDEAFPESVHGRTLFCGPTCSSHRLDSFNCQGPAQYDLLLQHPTEAAVTNRRRIDVDVAHHEGDSYLSNTDAIICGTCDHSGLGGDSMISDPNIVLSSTSTDDYHQQLLEWKVALDQIEEGLDVVCEIHRLPFAQIWIPDSQSSSIKAVIGRRSYDTSSSMYFNFVNASGLCFIQRGKAVVGRAFSSQGSCFCKNVTLLSLTEYPLVPSAREASLTRCFAICLRSKCISDFICVVEYFLPPNEIIDRDAETFLNMLLSTMKEQLQGVLVASGKELGQRMLVEVVKVSPFDELDFFEIGQPMPSVQSLQDGGEATEIDSLCKQSNLQNGEHNVTTALFIPSCSSHKRDSFNCEGPVQVDILHPHPTVSALANRGRVDVDVASDHIQTEKDASDMMQLDSHFEQPNVEIVSTGNGRNNDKVDDSDIATCRRQFVDAEAINEESHFIGGAMTNIQKINSQKNNKIQDHGVTSEKLEEQFGKTLVDAANNLSISQSTVQRIYKEYDISREKGTHYLAHKSSPALGKTCDSVMTIKVTYRDDIIKFKLTASSTMVELQEEVEKRLNISLEKFSIKYQDEDDDWVTITGDSDLREGMSELRLLGKTTMKLLVTPKSDT